MSSLRSVVSLRFRQISKSGWAGGAEGTSNDNGPRYFPQCNGEFKSVCLFVPNK